MERVAKQPTFVDGAVAGLGGPRTSRFLERVDQVIDWAQLTAPLRDLTPDQPKGGRPFWPLTVMVKCVLLAKWFGLSDPQLEEQLRDRLSFRSFVGLSWQDATPDETTFVKFRKRLREAGHGQTLFDTALAMLQAKGLVLQEGTLVDATIIESPKGRARDDGTSTRDTSASYTKKHGRTYNGYKAHIAVSKDRIITDYVFDTAKVHDSKHIDGLIENETQAVYADSAYMDRSRSERLKQCGVQDRIVQRRVRGQAALSQTQQRHNRACSRVRSLVEHPFAWMKQSMGYRRVRYRGLSRNGLDFALTAAAYNFKRSLSLLGLALTRGPTAVD